MIDLLLYDLNIQLTRTHIYNIEITLKKKTYQSFITLHTSIHLPTIDATMRFFYTILIPNCQSLACRKILNESELMAIGYATSSDASSR